MVDAKRVCKARTQLFFTKLNRLRNPICFSSKAYIHFHIRLICILVYRDDIFSTRIHTTTISCFDDTNMTEFWIHW